LSIRRQYLPFGIREGATRVIKESKTTEAVIPATKSPSELAAHVARVAARLFAERGYDATSVREIVEASGVTKPTLYYHFGSKQGLAEALLTKPMTEFITSLRGVVEEIKEPIELLRRMFESYINLISDEPDRGRFLYAICFGPQNSSLQAEMHEFGEAIDAVTADCARRLAEQGVIDRERVDSCSQVIRGLIMSSTLDHIMLGRPLEPGLADRLVVDLLQGFGRPGYQFDDERRGQS
jgi:AcrR family transcriptional regulator